MIQEEENVHIYPAERNDSDPDEMVRQLKYALCEIGRLSSNISQLYQRVDYLEANIVMRLANLEDNFEGISCKLSKIITPEFDNMCDSEVVNMDFFNEE